MWKIGTDRWQILLENYSETAAHVLQVKITQKIHKNNDFFTKKQLRVLPILFSAVRYT